MINIDDFLKRFKDQFVDPESCEINLQTEFREIESWDSLTGMSVLVMIKDEFDISFPEDKFRGCKTVRELFDALSKMS